jgi:hypothetical protein
LPSIIRDVIVVESKVLLYLDTGILMILDSNLEVFKRVKVAMKSFRDKPAPPLEMHQSFGEQSFVSV